VPPRPARRLPPGRKRQRGRVATVVLGWAERRRSRLHRSIEAGALAVTDAGRMVVRWIFVLLLAVSAALVPVSRATESPGSAAWSVIGVEQTRPCGSLGGVAADRAGGTLMLWSDCAGSSGSATTTVATRPAGGVFRRAGESPGVVTALARHGDGAVLAALTNGSNRGLRAADVSMTGRIVRVTQLTQRFVRWVAVAADDRGTRSSRGSRPWRRSASRCASAPGVIARSVQRSAWSRMERMLAASVWRSGRAGSWRSSGHRSATASVRCSPASAGRGAFEPPIPRRNDRLAVIDSAFTAMGNLVAIWRTTDAGEQQDRPSVVRVATLPNGSRRFIGRRTLGIGVDNDHWIYGHAVRATSAGGTAVVAWTDVKRRAPHARHARGAGQSATDTRHRWTVGRPRHHRIGHHPRQLGTPSLRGTRRRAVGRGRATPRRPTRRAPAGGPARDTTRRSRHTQGTRAVMASTAYDSAGSTITIYQQQIR
jgi:hypothetical protein